VNKFDKKSIIEMHTESSSKAPLVVWLEPLLHVPEIPGSNLSILIEIVCGFIRFSQTRIVRVS